MAEFDSAQKTPAREFALLAREFGKHLKNFREMGWKGWHQDRESVADIQDEISSCKKCALCQSRKNIVFGSGNPKARLMFVGEWPGPLEDEAGEPFVGPSGELLKKIIQAMGLDPQSVYMANIIKCRPPDNREPGPEEIAGCFAYLKRQIIAVSPEYICTLGQAPAQALLGTSALISELRGKASKFSGIPVMPTFHPEYLLTHENKKRDVWNDVRVIINALGLSGGS